MLFCKGTISMALFNWNSRDMRLSPLFIVATDPSNSVTDNGHLFYKWPNSVLVN